MANSTTPALVDNGNHTVHCTFCYVVVKQGSTCKNCGAKN